VETAPRGDGARGHWIAGSEDALALRVHRQQPHCVLREQRNHLEALLRAEPARELAFVEHGVAFALKRWRQRDHASTISSTSSCGHIERVEQREQGLSRVSGAADEAGDRDAHGASVDAGGGVVGGDAAEGEDGHVVVSEGIDPQGRATVGLARRREDRRPGDVVDAEVGRRRRRMPRRAEDRPARHAQPGESCVHAFRQVTPVEAKGSDERGVPMGEQARPRRPADRPEAGAEVGRLGLGGARLPRDDGDGAVDREVGQRTGDGGDDAPAVTGARRSIRDEEEAGQSRHAIPRQGLNERIGRANTTKRRCFLRWRARGPVEGHVSTQKKKKKPYQRPAIARKKSVARVTLLSNDSNGFGGGTNGDDFNGLVGSG